MRVTPYKKGQTMEQKWGIEKSNKIKEKISQRVKEVMNTPEFKEKLVKIMHQPEIRERQLRNRKPYSPTLEVREKIRNTVKYLFDSSPEYHQKIRDKRALQITPIKDTKIEVKIQEFLKELNIDFLTHQHIKQIELAYQADIIIPSIKTVIECDGDYWHGNLDVYEDYNHLNQWQKVQRIKDWMRTQQLEIAGYKVLRLWENDIKNMNLTNFQNELNSFNSFGQ